MTELALSSLATPLLGGYLDPPGHRRSEQAKPETAETREPRRESSREPERVVSGEVLSASENTYTHLKQSASRFSAGNETATSSGQTRRFSMQAAIQSFQDTESIVVDQNRAVQVSGIIDIYV